MAARKKDKEENETLDDLEHNEDGRGCCYQPLLKTDPEAADRSPSSIANVLRDLMRGGQQELRTGIASHFSPGLAALPHFQPCFFFRFDKPTFSRFSQNCEPLIVVEIFGKIVKRQVCQKRR